MFAVLLLVVTFIVLGLVPFLIGLKSSWIWKAILVFSAPPLVIGVVGLAFYQSALESPNSETQDWAELWLVVPIGAAILWAIAIAFWGVGRVIQAVRSRPRPISRLAGGKPEAPPAAGSSSATGWTVARKMPGDSVPWSRASRATSADPPPDAGSSTGPPLLQHPQH
jgi:hypothetical protein